MNHGSSVSEFINCDIDGWGREKEYSFLSPEVNNWSVNAWTYTSPPTFLSMVQCLIKQKENFTFTESKRYPYFFSFAEV